MYPLTHFEFELKYINIRIQIIKNKLQSKHIIIIKKILVIFIFKLTLIVKASRVYLFQTINKDRT